MTQKKPKLAAALAAFVIFLTSSAVHSLGPGQCQTCGNHIQCKATTVSGAGWYVWASVNGFQITGLPQGSVDMTWVCLAPSPIQGSDGTTYAYNNILLQNHLGTELWVGYCPMQGE